MIFATILILFGKRMTVGWHNAAQIAAWVETIAEAWYLAWML